MISADVNGDGADDVIFGDHRQHSRQAMHLQATDSARFMSSVVRT